MHTGGELGRELGVKRPGAAFGEVALDLGAKLRGHRRAQVELGERRAHVEARPADDDRAAPLVEQSVDLGVGERGEAPGRKLLVDPRDPDEPVLEPGLLGGPGGPAENLQPTVDLDRIAGDRDRILAALAQQLGDLDRDAGLADRRRAEDRQYPHRACRARARG